MSTIRAATISDLAGTGPATLTGQYAAKAWVNFNGETAAIRDSANVSSITDRGTGKYTVNFTAAMPDADYGVSTAIGPNSDDDLAALTLYVSGAPSTSSIQVNSTFSTSAVNGFSDRVYCYATITR